jgi:acyl carrier protein
MTNDGSCIEEVESLFRERLNIDVGNVDADLIEDGILDSLMLVELIFHLEQTLGVVVSIEDLELDHFRSIRAIACLVDSKLAN